MKRISLYLSLIAIVAVLMASCSKKMNPLASDMFTTEPTPLELVGTKVPVTINGRFPAKWFDKNTSVTVTPVLKYNGEELLGESQTYQGENVAGNGIVISNKEGGAMTLKSSFDYIPEMKRSELYLRFDLAKGGKAINAFPDLKIADGVNSTAALASALSVTPAVAPDAFQRIIKETHEADIMFLIEQAELRSSELNSNNLAAWTNLVKEAADNDRKIVKVEVAAYASPDGGLSLNEKLAEKREIKTSEYLDKEFLTKEIDTEVTAKYTAQDWDGFQRLVQASSLQDKDILLRVLSMYPDPETREREIKNISSVYSDLAQTILPKLRRSRLIANVEIIGKTDEELRKASQSDMSGLSAEELLYASTLKGISKEKIYKYVTDKYPTDPRGWNNLGALAFQNGDLKKAQQYFTSATKTGTRSPEANMNLALIALNENNVAKAEQLLGNASGASTINEALGLLYIKQGNFTKAAQTFGNSKTANAALAQILTKNYNKAQQIVDALPNKDATAYYLAAVIAARTNNAAGVAGNLRSALENGFSPAEVSDDIEFSKFMSNPDIKNMLR